jgi:hypothetical protein
MRLPVRLLFVLIAPKESFLARAVWPLARLLLMKLLFVQPKALAQLTLKESGNSFGYCSCIQLFFLESAPLQGSF